MPPREFKMGPQSAVARPQNRPGTSQDIDHLDNVKLSDSYRMEGMTFNRLQASPGRKPRSLDHLPLTWR
jgi:hypothetical protein